MGVQRIAFSLAQFHVVCKKKKKISKEALSVQVSQCPCEVTQILNTSPFNIFTPQVMQFLTLNETTC